MIKFIIYLLIISICKSKIVIESTIYRSTDPKVINIMFNNVEATDLYSQFSSLITVNSIENLSSNQYSVQILTTDKINKYQIKITYSNDLKTILRRLMTVGLAIPQSLTSKYSLNVSQLQIKLDIVYNDINEDESFTLRAIVNSQRFAFIIGSMMIIISDGSYIIIRSLFFMDFVQILRFLEVTYPQLIQKMFESDLNYFQQKYFNIEFWYDDGITVDFHDFYHTPEKYRQYGISANIFVNMGSYIGFNIFLLFLGVCFYLVEKYLYNKVNNKIFGKIYNSLVWNSVFGFFLANMLRGSLYAWVAVKSLPIGKNNNFSIGYLSIVWFLPFHFYILNKTGHKIKEELEKLLTLQEYVPKNHIEEDEKQSQMAEWKKQNKFRSIIYNYYRRRNPETMIEKICICFYNIYNPVRKHYFLQNYRILFDEFKIGSNLIILDLFRVYFLSQSLVFLDIQTDHQLLACLIIQVLCTIFVAYNKPFENQFNNMMSILSELMVLLAIIFVIVIQHSDSISNIGMINDLGFCLALINLLLRFITISVCVSGFLISIKQFKLYLKVNQEQYEQIISFQQTKQQIFKNKIESKKFKKEYLQSIGINIFQSQSLNQSQESDLNSSKIKLDPSVPVDHHFQVVFPILRKQSLKQIQEVSQALKQSKLKKQNSKDAQQNNQK